jgi:hypothetical protein
MTTAQPITYPRDWKVTCAALSMLAAGILHMLIIPHHWEHAPAHGLAMGVIGVLEVLWAIAYWLRPSRLLAQLGILLAVSMIALWVFTRIVPAPFTNEAEEVDFSGVLTKIMEAVSAVALVAVVLGTAPEAGAGRSAWRSIVSLLVVSILLAAGIYGIARLAQPFLPQLGPPPMDQMDMGNQEQPGCNPVTSKSCFDL